MILEKFVLLKIKVDEEVSSDEDHLSQIIQNEIVRGPISKVESIQFNWDQMYDSIIAIAVEDRLNNVFRILEQDSDPNNFEDSATSKDILEILNEEAESYSGSFLEQPYLGFEHFAQKVEENITKAIINHPKLKELAANIYAKKLAHV